MMQRKRKILISGAGIAGPTLAYWLIRQGFSVTVVERAPSFRLGGQNIDVSDAAVEVVKRMGIHDAILAHNTTEQGLLFVDQDGRTQAALPKGTATSFTSKYEILRGDLSQIIYDLSRDKADYRFGDSIEAIQQTQAGVLVSFHSGRQEDFDLLIGADGVGSKTRDLIFGSRSAYRYLGVYTSYMTIPKRSGDSKWARWYNASGGRVILLRPDNKGTTRASVNFLAPELLKEQIPHAEVIAVLRRVLRDAGWEADRISADLESDRDIYLGPVSQVKLPRWSQGRCVLLGDAAYCPTPFTGMGSTLAVIGAYVLAGELAKTTDHEAAFRQYEEVLRPFVEEVQRLPPGVPRIAYPKTRIGIAVFHKALAVFASSIVQNTIGFCKGQKRIEKTSFVLPRYEF